MSTNAKPVDLPHLIHYPLDQATVSTPDAPLPNPTCVYNHTTHTLIPFPYLTDPRFQFKPKNGTVVFNVNEFGVVVVQLNRPKALNAFNLDLIEDLYDVIQFLIKNQSVFRCVIIGSTSKDLSAGLDIVSVMGGGKGIKADKGGKADKADKADTGDGKNEQNENSNQKQRNGMKELLTPYDSRCESYSDYDFDNLVDPLTILTPTPSSGLKLTTHNIVQHLCIGWQMMSIPVISYVNGLALGAGFQLIMGADIRFATIDAKVSILESKWGIIPDMGITSLARMIIPEDKLKYLCFSSEFVNGREDLNRFNIFTEIFHNVDELYHKLNIFINNLLFKPPNTIRSLKLNLNLTSPFKSFLTPFKWEYERENGRKVHFEPRFTGLNIEQLLQVPLLLDRNQKILTKANVERKLPIFIVDYDGLVWGGGIIKGREAKL
jgi:enoyl-CoA hydratase/carnithine racemase